MTNGVKGFLAVIVCFLVGAGAIGFSVGKSTGNAPQSATTPDILATFMAVVDATARAHSTTAPSTRYQNAAAGQPAAQQSVVVTPVPQRAAPASILPNLEAQFATQAAANRPAAQQRTGLTIQEVLGWCRGTGCTADHFQQLPETGGIINPNGVLFMITAADQASDFTLPVGVSADVWSCFPPSTRAVGPTVLSHVCQASFRKG